MSTRAQRAELVSKPPKNLGEFAASTKTQTAARARKQSGKLNETFAAKLPAAACCLLLPAAACCLLLPAAGAAAGGCCCCCCAAAIKQLPKQEAATAAAAVPTKTRPSRTGKHHGAEGRMESKIDVSRGRNVPSEIS